MDHPISSYTCQRRRLAQKRNALTKPSVGAFQKTPGGDLLSRAVAHAVPSALEDFTSVFGMGTGVSPPLWPPGILHKLSGSFTFIAGFTIHRSEFLV